MHTIHTRFYMGRELLPTETVSASFKKDNRVGLLPISTFYVVLN
jgi:hypothetical protein